jgi:hypothetical protein
MLEVSMRKFYAPMLVFLAVMLLSEGAFAQQFFRWRHPGGDKYQGTMAQALDRFADKVPADVRQLLLQQYQTRQPVPTGRGYEGAITNGVVYAGMKTVRMTFGNGKVVPNVVVDPQDFASAEWQRASKNVVMYEITKKTPARYETYYVLVFEECGNVALVILDSQGDCIKDTTLCPDCHTIKAVAPQRVSWGPKPPTFFRGPIFPYRHSIKSR